MTRDLPPLHVVLDQYLAAPVNPECQARLRAALEAEDMARWISRWDPAHAVLAEACYLWMDFALAASDDLRRDYCGVIRTLFNTLTAGRRRADRQKKALERKFPRSEPPSNAWWLDKDD